MMKFIFPIISIIIFNVTAFLIPRRLTRIEIYAGIFFTMYLQYNVDIVLDLKFDFYRMLEKGPDLLPLIIFSGIYPAYSYIFLNFFPFTRALRYKLLYILLHTVIVTIFEWLSLKSGYFTYVKWKLWYSSICDVVIFIILASNLLLIRKIINKDYKKLV